MLPAFCRVQGVIRPSNDSHIEFEVWLPMSAWNGRYLGVGNGGAAGSIPYEGNLNTPGLVEALKDGFATSATDTGHQGRLDDFSFGVGHPEQRIDYYYRAIHETAVTAKAVIGAFYGTGPRYSYFWGRSFGGGQALMEVQRYPADYDGVLAASPGLDRAATYTAWAWIAQAFAAEESQIPQNKLPVIQAAVIRTCDGVDGLKDGIIGDPMRCRFDPDVLLCKGSDLNGCLTPSQVAALKKYYDGPRNSKGDRIASSFPPGAEACVGNSMTCPGAAARRASIWFDGLFGGRFTVQTFSFDRDAQALAQDLEVKLGDATNSNLEQFMDRGGKLIIEHGWSDGTLPPTRSVKYFESVVSTMGEKAVHSFLRLYMVPGMSHSGAPGLPDVPVGPASNRFRALQRWVETGEAPGSILASRYRVDADPASGLARTRLLCPYPEVAVYKGSGSVDDAVNFSCKVP
jgi:feruloyl esterase